MPDEGNNNLSTAAGRMKAVVIGMSSYSSFSKIYFSLFIYLFSTQCSLWDVSSQPRFEPKRLVMRVMSPNHSPAREFPPSHLKLLVRKGSRVLIKS